MPPYVLIKYVETIKNSIGNNIDDIYHEINLHGIVYVIYIVQIKPSYRLRDRDTTLLLNIHVVHIKYIYIYLSLKIYLTRMICRKPSQYQLVDVYVHARLYILNVHTFRLFHARCFIKRNRYFLSPNCYLLMLHLRLLRILDAVCSDENSWTCKMKKEERNC